MTTEPGAPVPAAAWADLGRRIEAAHARDAASPAGAVADLARWTALLTRWLEPWLQGEATPDRFVLEDWLARTILRHSPSEAAERTAADRWLTLEAKVAMTAELLQASGREVSFVLRRQPNGQFGAPRVSLRGSAAATHMVYSDWGEGSLLLLHNHPPGLLEPSAADLDACMVSLKMRPDIGWGIVSNAADRLYLLRDPPGEAP